MNTTLTLKPELRVHTRWLLRRDMPDAVRLLAELPCPWTAGDLDDFLGSPRGTAHVAEVPDPSAECGWRLAGMMLSVPGRKEIALEMLAVAPRYRRLGVASALVERLKMTLSRERRNRVVCDVREGNLGLQLFLKRQGFLAVRLKRGFFQDTGEDAVRFGYFCPGRPV